MDRRISPKLKSFLSSFKKQKILFLCNDIGSLNCAEVIIDFLISVSSVTVHCQSKVSKKFFSKKVGWSNPGENLIDLKKFSGAVIFQSSSVSEIEKKASNSNSILFVIQDYIHDFKFGLNAPYLTAFDYDGTNSYKTHVFPELRPIIIGHNNFNLCDDVLLIGSPHLWRFKQSWKFLDRLINDLNTGIKIFYRMHPNEIIMPRSEHLLPFGAFEVGCRVPRYVISSFSSLAYDLANEVKKYKNESLVVLEGFCSDYNDWYLKLVEDNILVSQYSVNHFYEERSKFIGYINEKNGIHTLSKK